MKLGNHFSSIPEPWTESVPALGWTQKARFSHSPLSPQVGAVRKCSLPKPEKGEGMLILFARGTKHDVRS